MKTVITIVELSSMPGRFEFTLKNPMKRPIHGDAGRDPQAAAAKAVDLAMHHGIAGYHIFASKRVLECIPAELRAQ